MNNTYTSEEVNNIINIILEEADKSIENAYNEGYKQATLELKPELNYWKTLYEEESKNNKTTLYKYCGISFGAGFIVGSLTTFCITIPLFKN